MTNFLQMINSKLNKGLKNILLINIIVLLAIFIYTHITKQTEEYIYYLVFLTPVLYVSIFIFPFVLIYTSPKFIKKEKINFILYYVYINLFFVILLALTKSIVLINILSLLNPFYYVFYTSFLFWTHRKNDYRIE